MPRHWRVYSCSGKACTNHTTTDSYLVLLTGVWYLLTNTECPWLPISCRTGLQNVLFSSKSLSYMGKNGDQATRFTGFPSKLPTGIAKHPSSDWDTDTASYHSCKYKGESAALHK